MWPIVGGASRNSDWHSSPMPITAQQAQQNPPPRSNYTSLKRSHSTISNGSAGSIDRKTGSPKEDPVVSASQKTHDGKPLNIPSKKVGTIFCWPCFEVEMKSSNDVDQLQVMSLCKFSAQSFKSILQFTANSKQIFSGIGHLDESLHMCGFNALDPLCNFIQESCDVRR